MQFDYAGQKFSIEFAHIHRKRHKHPLTVCRLIEVGGDVAHRTVVAEAEARCHDEDVYSKELGRHFAIQKLAAPLPRALAGHVLSAYYNRPHPKDPASLELAIKRLEAELWQVMQARTQDRA